MLMLLMLLMRIGIRVARGREVPAPELLKPVNMIMMNIRMARLAHWMLLHALCWKRARAAPSLVLILALK